MRNPCPAAECQPTWDRAPPGGPVAAVRPTMRGAQVPCTCAHGGAGPPVPIPSRTISAGCSHRVSRDGPAHGAPDPAQGPGPGRAGRSRCTSRRRRRGSAHAPRRRGGGRAARGLGPDHPDMADRDGGHGRRVGHNRRWSGHPLSPGSGAGAGGHRGRGSRHRHLPRRMARVPIPVGPAETAATARGCLRDRVRPAPLQLARGPTDDRAEDLHRRFGPARTCLCRPSCLQSRRRPGLPGAACTCALDTPAQVGITAAGFAPGACRHGSIAADRRPQQ